MNRSGAIEYFSRQAQRVLGSSLARLILFGSVAAGEAAEQSDIDIAVIHFGAEREVLEKVAAIGFETALR